MSFDPFGIIGTLQAEHFRIQGAVAEGGFAVVYKAFHEGFGAPCALKCLKVPASLTDEQRDRFVAKFNEEAKLLFLLSHATPNVVRPLQVGTLVTNPTDGRYDATLVPFLALEWLEGQSLEEIRASRVAAGKQPYDVARAVLLLAPAAHAIDKAHKLKTSSGFVTVVHCDLKPDNIVVSTEENPPIVKVLDFGIARVKRAFSAVAGAATSSNDLRAFSPQYAAPEQWNPVKFGQLGPWTDVYALALSMVELVSGKLALEGDVAALMASGMNEAARPTPRALGATVSDEVEQVFETALAVDPRRRFQTVTMFWSALEEALELPLSFLPSRNLVASIPPPPSTSAPAPPPAAREASAAAQPAAQPASPPRRPKPPLPPPRSRAPSTPPSTSRSAPPPVSSRSAPPRSAPAPVSSRSAPPRSAPPSRPDAPTPASRKPEIVRPFFDDRAHTPREALASGLDLDTSVRARVRGPLPSSAPQRTLVVTSTPFDLKERLRGPSKLVGVAVALVAIEHLLRLLSLDLPVRPYFLAAPLGALAVLWALSRLLPSSP